MSRSLRVRARLRDVLRRERSTCHPSQARRSDGSAARASPSASATAPSACAARAAKASLPCRRPPAFC